jgi:hypothetical protein
MRSDTTNKPTRREFFAALARYAALGVLAGGGAFLLSRNGAGGGASPCRRCPAAGRCDLERPEPDRCRAKRDEESR